MNDLITRPNEVYVDKAGWCFAHGVYRDFLFLLAPLLPHTPKATLVAMVLDAVHLSAKDRAFGSWQQWYVRVPTDYVHDRLVQALEIISSNSDFDKFWNDTAPSQEGMQRDLEQLRTKRTAAEKSHSADCAKHAALLSRCGPNDEEGIGEEIHRLETKLDGLEREMLHLNHKILTHRLMMEAFGFDPLTD